MTDIPSQMKAVQLVGHGGFEKLQYRVDISTPKPKAGEVLIKVSAAGVNNTDINTRIGWYSKTVTESTNEGGATVYAVSGGDKREQVLSAGADVVLEHGSDLIGQIGTDTIDVVIDLVAGDGVNELLDILKYGGRYAIAGAIAGPICAIDMRTIYLKDLSIFGCTFQNDGVFENLVGYINQNKIKPIVAKTYPLENIVQAQSDFIAKQFVGKLVLIIPE